MNIFDIRSKPGEKVFNYIEMFEYPHGNKEKLPICIIQGLEEGPTFLLTGNIHGDELHGLVTLQEVIKEIDANRLKGTLIIVPSLNPAGLLTLTRSPFYIGRTDPNRLWPDPKPKETPELKYEDPYDELFDDEKNPNVQELFYTKFAEIFDEIDYFIDLHCHAIRSFPFSYLDRVYYDEKKEGEKEKAEELYKKNHSFVEAFGLTIILENAPKIYFKANLHRSTTGSFVNKYRKPGFTVELGASGIVDNEIIKAAKIGVFNVLKWAKMIDGEIEPITNLTVFKDILWREVDLRASTSGFFIPLVEIGEIVEKDTPIIEIRDIFGNKKETIDAPEYGNLLAVWDDIRCYPNSQIGTYLIKNTIDVVLPWEYEKKKEEKEEAKD